MSYLSLSLVLPHIFFIFLLLFLFFFFSFFLVFSLVFRASLLTIARMPFIPIRLKNKLRYVSGIISDVDLRWNESPEGLAGVSPHEYSALRFWYSSVLNVSEVSLDERNIHNDEGTISFAWLICILQGNLRKNLAAEMVTRRQNCNDYSNIHTTKMATNSKFSVASRNV